MNCVIAVYVQDLSYDDMLRYVTLWYYRQIMVFMNEKMGHGVVFTCICDQSKYNRLPSRHSCCFNIFISSIVARLCGGWGCDVRMRECLFNWSHVQYI